MQGGLSSFPFLHIPLFNLFLHVEEPQYPNPYDIIFLVLPCLCLSQQLYFFSKFIYFLDIKILYSHEIPISPSGMFPMSVVLFHVFIILPFIPRSHMPATCPIQLILPLLLCRSVSASWSLDEVNSCYTIYTFLKFLDHL